MPILKFDIRVSDNASKEELSDALVKLARELEWLINGNLDEKNVKSMRFMSGTVIGDVRFEGNVRVGDGIPLGTIELDDSIATNLTELKTDLNELLAVLRSIHILHP